MVRWLFLLFPATISAQVSWERVDSLYSPLPAGVHVYKTHTLLDGKANIAYYVEAPLQDKALAFEADTTYRRRLTPAEFYAKNGGPLVVVNTTFFSFATNQNLNLVIKDGKLVSYNVHSLPGKGKDTLTYRHPLGSAIGIFKNRRADVAWLYTDSTLRYAYARQTPLMPVRDSLSSFRLTQFFSSFPPGEGQSMRGLKRHTRWRVETAVGGGPVLVQNGEVLITNNEEIKFAGKAIDDRHPRTAMGYTADGRLIILAVEGRHPGRAEGASLVHLARLLKDLGCVEAINLDGGGSSCLLVNGRPTIQVSDAAGQRPVPAVFIIRALNR